MLRVIVLSFVASEAMVQKCNMTNVTSMILILVKTRIAVKMRFCVFRKLLTFLTAPYFEELTPDSQISSQISTLIRNSIS